MEHSRPSGSRFVMTTHRIENLSDSIFAFSMTLLVMNFTFPAGGALVNDGQVTQLFLKEISKFDRYVLTFILLAILWIGHHQQFHHIKRTDRRFLWIQVAILLFIVMVPFTAAWMSAYSSFHITNLVFDLNLFILGFLFLISWLYATHKRRLVEEDIEHRIRTRRRSTVDHQLLRCPHRDNFLFFSSRLEQLFLHSYPGSHDGHTSRWEAGFPPPPIMPYPAPIASHAMR